MYVTLYVYGTTNRAAWYAATLHYAGSDAAGNLLYTGDLFESTGPWFGALFTPGLVTVRRAGEATFRATSVETATLTYSVDNIVVDKNIERFTLATNDISGDYIGGIVQTNYNCTNPAQNGKTEDAAYVTITQAAADVQIATTSARRSCNYRGTYGQSGRAGSVANASFACSDGTSGTFAAFEIEMSTSGILARFFGTGGGCSFTGDVGGVFR